MEPEELKKIRFEIDNRKEFMISVLRECIGKTDDISVSLCSHKAIINRELGEGFCRVCQKDLRNNEGRYNDYKILQHPLCRQPICLNCAETNPDEFHKAFKNGTEEMKRMNIF